MVALKYWYHTLFHTSTITTPFRDMCSRDPPRMFGYGSLKIPVSKVQYFEEQDRFRLELRGYLFQAQQLMKDKADKHHREVEFMVGD